MPTTITSCAELLPQGQSFDHAATGGKTSQGIVSSMAMTVRQ
jgi:hypothetical protein